MTPTTWLLDLDGVMWLGDEPIPGSADAVARLVAAGCRVGFCTNNSSAKVSEYRSKLLAHGTPEPAASGVLTSGMAAAALLTGSERVMVCGGPGLVEEVGRRGCETVDPSTPRPGPVDAVVIGFDRRFDYARLSAASGAVLAGARLLATNSDATYPVVDGLLPGCGALLAAVERASGTTATVAGKPNQPMVDLVRNRMGDSTGIMVGDRVDTDGRFATALGWRFALVGTGVTRPDAVPAPGEPPDAVGASDLASLVTTMIGT